MNEASLKRSLKQAILRELPRAVPLRHEDQMSGGIPDLSVTVPGLPEEDEARACRVVWVEVKYQRVGRKVSATPLQRTMLMRLSGALVTYVETRQGLRSVVVEWFDTTGPREVFRFEAPARQWTKHHRQVALELKARLEAR